jgi:AraC-like DNA-binding protein
MQFSRRREAVPAGRAALQEVQRWIATNPDAHHTVSALAERVGLSPRHFARLFRSEVGLTPAAWVERARVNAAQKLLETGQLSPKQVASQCGFSDTDAATRLLTSARCHTCRIPKTARPYSGAMISADDEDREPAGAATAPSGCAGAPTSTSAGSFPGGFRTAPGLLASSQMGRSSETLHTGCRDDFIDSIAGGRSSHDGAAGCCLGIQSAAA